MLAFGERSQLVLGSSQMLIWFLTRFSVWFSQWEPIETFTCEKRIENWSQVFTWMKTCYENRFKFIHFIFLENRTSCLIELRSDSQNLYIIYWFHLVFFSPGAATIGSLLFFFSLGVATLLLLLFSCCYYFSFYHCYSSLVIAITVVSGRLRQFSTE